MVAMESILIVSLFLLAAVIIVGVLVNRSRAGKVADQNQLDLRSLRESVDRLDNHIFNQLTPQVGSVDSIAGELRKTLSSPNRRGQWAEQSLTNLLENSGLRENDDYKLQFTIDDGEKRLRPDAVVFMPRGVKVVIDAKAPWDSYQEAHSMTTDEAARPHLEKHAANLLKRAEDLGNSNYSDAIAGSPDFVLMFVPADPIVDAAMKVQPDLWEQAWRKHKVLIVTPGTLMVFLKTVTLAWQQHEINKNAQQIAALGEELFNRFNVFAGHLKKMGIELGKTVDAYNKGVGSLQSRVLPQARRFQDLGAVARTDQLADPELVADAVRELHVPKDLGEEPTGYGTV